MTWCPGCSREVDGPCHHYNCPVGREAELGRYVVIEHDGFIGEVIGSYVTREGEKGVVLQQVGTLVVHVYGTQWLK